MKKLICLFLLLLPIVVNAFAIEAVIDGNKYYLDKSTHSAAIVGNKYSGEITIPSTVDYESESYSVTSIFEMAFSDCSGLTSVTIPSSVTSIGYYAFRYCSGLTSIKVDKNNAVYDSRNNCNAIIKTVSNSLMVGCKNTVIPQSVISINHCAFYGCKGLTSLTIPNSVDSIGHFAFSFCSGLTSVTIPNSVKYIGETCL